MIKRIKVHTTEALKDPLYRFPNNYGVEKFLELFSEEDYDAFCLAYMFTYRDFEMGTLGLAWTGDMKNAGGVCEKNGVSKILSILHVDMTLMTSILELGICLHISSNKTLFTYCLKPLFQRRNTVYNHVQLSL